MQDLRFEKPENLLHLTLTLFNRKTVLIIGDLMLDRYLIGDVHRVSPEAPVPILQLQREENRMGGAANVAYNLCTLGLKVSLVGVVGNDEAGRSLLDIAAKNEVDVDSILSLNDRPTTLKIRVMDGHHHLIRIDAEQTHPLPIPVQSQLLANLENAFLGAPDAIILSDYAKGVLSPEVCQFVIQRALASNIPVFVDPKGLDFNKYKGATGLFPNLPEFTAVTQASNYQTQAFQQAMYNLVEQLEMLFLTVTLGKNGMIIADQKDIATRQSTHLTSVAKEVYDVSGAGDMAISLAVVALINQVSILDAHRLAIVGSAIVVGRSGLSIVTTRDLYSKLCDYLGQPDTKVLTSEVLSQQVTIWRTQGKRIVFTNGCFDILHTGHVTYLQKARQLGDCLIVGLNTDASVRQIKGSSRPIVSEQDRSKILSALSAVDAVVLFDQPTLLSLINLIQPAVLVKGADYDISQVVGAEEVQAHGGEVVLIPLVEDRSTTGLIDKILQTAN